MLRFKLSRCALILCFYCIGAVHGLQADEHDLQPILDGRSLDGWVIEGNRAEGIWNVTPDGELFCKGSGYGFLRYDKKLCDFGIKLEYKMSPDCNSGIGIRSKAYTGGNTRPSASGYELQILADASKQPTNRSSMSLYRYLAPKINATLPAGQWNTLEIVCLGPHIKVTLNDKLVHDLDQSKYERIKDKPLCGYFSVQNHDKSIWFRNIRLRELKPDAP